MIRIEKKMLFLARSIWFDSTRFDDYVQLLTGLLLDVERFSTHIFTWLPLPWSILYISVFFSSSPFSLFILMLSFVFSSMRLNLLRRLCKSGKAINSRITAFKMIRKRACKHDDLRYFVRKNHVFIIWIDKNVFLS